jgi:hypothetical protein
MEELSGKKTQRVVYAIVEKPGLKKSQWVKVGVAFVNHDQSINVHLDALPYDRKLQIREEEVRPRPSAPAAPTYERLPLPTFDAEGIQ